MNKSVLFKLVPKVSLTLVVLGAMAGSAGATSLFLGGGGGLNGGGLSVAISSTCINFYNSLNPDACPNAGALDTWTVGAPSDAGLFTLGAVGTIKDVPSGAPSVVAFITVGSIVFNMSRIRLPAHRRGPRVAVRPAISSSRRMISVAGAWATSPVVFARRHWLYRDFRKWFHAIQVLVQLSIHEHHR